MEKVKGYTGVYRNRLESGDVAYYITWTWESKKKWLKVGLHSEGVRLAYCKKRRGEIMVKLRNGEEPYTSLKKRNKKTLDEVATEFFEKKAYKSKTYRTLWGRYTNHSSPTLGKKPISSITVEDIETLFLSKKNSEKLSDKTVQLIMEQLSSIFYHAIAKGEYQGENPCKGIKIKRVDNARTRYLSMEEIELLLERTKEHQDAHLFTLLSLSTGARLHDVYNMQKKHFNLTDRTVTIRNTKGNSTYQAFLTKRVLKHIHLDDLEPNDILYRVSERTIQRYMKKVLDELFNVGLDERDSKNRVVIHTLRHTFASQLAIAGTPIYEIKKLLDHKNIEDTLRYAKLSPESGREFVERLF